MMSGRIGYLAPFRPWVTPLTLPLIPSNYGGYRQRMWGAISCAIYRLRDITIYHAGGRQLSALHCWRRDDKGAWPGGNEGASGPVAEGRYI